jgi:hypothetical protein
MDAVADRGEQSPRGAATSAMWQIACRERITTFAPIVIGSQAAYVSRTLRRADDRILTLDVIVVKIC